MNRVFNLTGTEAISRRYSYILINIYLFIGFHSLNFSGVGPEKKIGMWKSVEVSYMPFWERNPLMHVAHFKTNLHAKLRSISLIKNVF